MTCECLTICVLTGCRCPVQQPTRSYDVTLHVQTEMEMREVLDAEHRILEECFPRHGASLWHVHTHICVNQHTHGCVYPALFSFVRLPLTTSVLEIIQTVNIVHAPVLSLCVLPLFVTVLEVMTSDKRRTSGLPMASPQQALTRHPSLPSSMPTAGPAATLQGLTRHPSLPSSMPGRDTSSRGGCGGASSVAATAAAAVAAAAAAGDAVACAAIDVGRCGAQAGACSSSSREKNLSASVGGLYGSLSPGNVPGTAPPVPRQGEQRRWDNTGHTAVTNTGAAAAAACRGGDEDPRAESESDPAPQQRSSAPPRLMSSGSRERTEQPDATAPPPSLTGSLSLTDPPTEVAAAAASSAAPIATALGGHRLTGAAAAAPTGNLFRGQLPASYRRRASTSMLYGTASCSQLLLHRLPPSPLPLPLALGGPGHTAVSGTDSSTLLRSDLSYEPYSCNDERFTGLSLHTLRLGSELSSDWGPAAAAAATVAAAAAAGNMAASVAGGVAADESPASDAASVLAPTTPAVPYGGFGAGFGGMGGSRADAQQYMARAHEEVSWTQARTHRQTTC